MSSSSSPTPPTSSSSSSSSSPPSPPQNVPTSSPSPSPPQTSSSQHQHHHQHNHQSSPSNGDAHHHHHSHHDKSTPSPSLSSPSQAPSPTAHTHDDSHRHQHHQLHSNRNTSTPPSSLPPSVVTNGDIHHHHHNHHINPSPLPSAPPQLTTEGISSSPSPFPSDPSSTSSSSSSPSPIAPPSPSRKKKEKEKEIPLEILDLQFEAKWNPLRDIFSSPPYNFPPYRPDQKWPPSPLPCLPSISRGPTRHSNWILKPSLANGYGGVILSAYPSSHDERRRGRLVRRLVGETRVTTFVNFMTPLEKTWRITKAKFSTYEDKALGYAATHSGPQIRFIQFPVVDGDIGADFKVVELAQKLFDMIRNNPLEIILLHCWGGHGRSGTLSSILLGLIHNIPPPLALQLNNLLHSTRKKNSHDSSPQTEPQHDQVKRILTAIREGKVEELIKKGKEAQGTYLNNLFGPQIFPEATPLSDIITVPSSNSQPLNNQISSTSSSLSSSLSTSSDGKSSVPSTSTPVINNISSSSSSPSPPLSSSSDPSQAQVQVPGQAELVVSPNGSISADSFTVITSLSALSISGPDGVDHPNQQGKGKGGKASSPNSSPRGTKKNVGGNSYPTNGITHK